MSPGRVNRKLDGLFIVCAIGLVFMAFSYMRIVGDAGSALLGGSMIEFVLKQPIWGTQLGIELLQFAAALVLLHLFVAVASWAMARLTLLAWPDSGTSQRVLAVFWLAVALIWVMAANARWFPRTSLGAPYDHIVTAEAGGITVFSILTLGVLAAVATVIITAAARARPGILRSRSAWAVGSVCLAASAALPTIDVFGSSGAVTNPDKPHVILVGLDSLRTDFVQNEQAKWTPAIDAFLSRSVSFSDAYTPLARTFPAWVSIVSGRHPHTTGAYVNLLPRDLIDEGPTLPSVLGSNGYQTVYAIDEVRFSNLDESYGFDRMLAPAMGSADFMLGFFSDTPLANVVVNTRLGKWLFPYGYANRAAANTYYPETFVDRIDSAIDFDEPTLLAVHFTLAHWPYTWADSPKLNFPPSDEPLENEEIVRRRYEFAIRRLDEQFNRLIEMLDRKGALENSVVVVLSDHGESLGEPSPIFSEDQSIDPNLTTSSLFGHGTHVLSKDQYHVVLALRSFGNELVPKEPGSVLSFPVSLEDVTPTILDALDLDHGQSFDGRSLLAYMEGDPELLAGAESRIRFLETEFNPPGFSPGQLISASAVTKAADKYLIDPETDRVLIRPDFIGEMLAKRQYAAELGGEILATVPATGDFREQYLLYFDPAADLHVWFDEPPSAINDPERHALWQSLEDRFAKVRDRPVVPKPEWSGSGL